MNLAVSWFAGMLLENDITVDDSSATLSSVYKSIMKDWSEDQLLIRTESLSMSPRLAISTLLVAVHTCLTVEDWDVILPAAWRAYQETQASEHVSFVIGLYPPVDCYLRFRADLGS
jgi:hypothetical protein